MFFKSIEHKLILFLCLQILSVAAAVWGFGQAEYLLGSLSALLAVLSVIALVRQYRKFNENILFLLQALDNGDYAFYFTEAQTTRREREINQLLNRIKEILTRARTEVIRNEKFLEVIVESVSVGLLILDDHHIRFVNEAAKKLLNMPVLTHLNQLGMVDESFPALFKGLEPGLRKQIKVQNEREEVQLSVRASLITAGERQIRIITLHNIGNELEAQEMESWIRLIRVMTHEIMNSIAPITSLSDTLLSLFRTRRQEAEDPVVHNTVEALETISSTAKGLLSFVESYRKFTGIPKPVLKEFDVRGLVESIVTLESEAAGAKGVQVEITGDREFLPLKADEAQITQVLLNLIKNAIEAIEEGQEGRIRVHLSVREGKTQVVVSNNGTPIPAEVLPHIFIPFFTTKEAGSGIGLSISRYILRLHGGNLKHQYTGGWTSFVVNFAE